MFLIWMYPGIISRDGIGAYTFWGRYRFIDWNNVERVSSRRIIGLKYLNIFIENQKRPLWLFSGNEKKLKEIAKQLELGNNPLKDYLKNEKRET